MSADARRGDRHPARRGGRPARRGRVPARARSEMADRRGRVHGRRTQPGRPGRYRHGQVPRLPGARRPLRRAGGGGHRHQGPPGPAGRQGPAARGRRHRQRPDVRRAQGSQQLRLPPAGGRDRRPGRPADPRAGLGRPARRRRHPDPGGRRRRRRDPATIADQVRSLVRWAGGHRPPGTAPSCPSSPTSGHGPWCRPRPASARAPSGARRDGTASPNTPAAGPPRPTSSWSTPTSTGPTWPAAGPCCPSTRWWCSTRPTRSRTS